VKVRMMVRVRVRVWVWARVRVRVGHLTRGEERGAVGPVEPARSGEVGERVRPSSSEYHPIWGPAIV
jgi:hypothetical protein